MSFNDKFGSYITKLMTTILDSEQEQFVKDLALSELKKLNGDINDFIVKHLNVVDNKINLTGTTKSLKQLMKLMNTCTMQLYNTAQTLEIQKLCLM